MAARRDYFDGCAAAHALDLVGERWALLVVRELMLGPKRFTDLRTGLPHASPNVLSQRLRELEDAGVLYRRRLPPPAASAVYQLTEWGLELEPVLQTPRPLGGPRAPARGAHRGRLADPLAAHLFSPELAADRELTLQLHLDEQPFRVHVSGGTLEVERGEVRDPDAVVRCSPEIFGAVVHLGHPIDDAVADGSLTITGDREALVHFADCTRMPAPLSA